MISVVCVYNNDKTLSNVLLKSLKNQTVEYELITLDNRDKRFKSAAEALNHGGAKAKGDYIMFVHQDMWLGTDSWLEDAEKTLEAIPDLGIAGVAGMSEAGKNWEERVRFSIGVYDEPCWERIGSVEKAEEVQTLDECLLIVPETVFRKLRFDEKVFDGWDCYGADYCLSIEQLGLKAYVIPAPCSHSCLRARSQIWEFKNLIKYQRRLYRKHKSNYKRIFTWMGEVSWPRLLFRMVEVFVSPLYEFLFPHMFILMKRELSGCDSVLDLGCGHHSPLQVCDIPFSVGVEMFEPSLQESRRKGIHSEYVIADIRRVDFKPKSFDAVIAVEVLEHLTKQEGAELLSRMEQWARKKIILTTPNGYLHQDTYDSNPLQEHKSGWTVNELRALGFRVRGLAGLKVLRGDKGSIRYRPALLWAIISSLTQKLTYYFPKLAFQLMAVKKIDYSGRK